MAQKLILPFDDCQINAGYKSARYKKDWGFTHYGIDLVEKKQQRTLYASGNGMVVACGKDGATDKDRLGNCVVVVYNDVQLADGRKLNLSCRMFHLARIDCKVGQTVRAGTVLGEYGSTGAYSSGPHLHIEFDSDVRYPTYAVGIGQDGNVIKRGTIDSTLDPCKVLWLGAGQSLTAPAAWVAEGWVAAESLQLPQANATGGEGAGRPEDLAEIARLQAENNALRAKLVQIHTLSA